MTVKRNQLNYRVALGLAILFCSAIVIATGAMSAQANSSSFQRRPLTNATPQEVGEVAVQFTQVNYPSLTGNPQVVLARTVTIDELPKLGLGTINFGTIETPPLMLVIVKGNFDASKARGIIDAKAKANRKVTYIGYVFDLWAGVPCLTITSPQGGSFRLILNDPSIPSNTLDQPLPVVDQPAQLPQPTLHYGETVPPEVLPTKPTK